jgi:glycosyltransferase involved in cell wall biosynthesis
MVLDTSYALEAIRARRLETSVTCRDLGGYFDRVWTVHPFATLVTSPAWSERHGRPSSTTLDVRHVFIEGKVGRSDALGFLPPLNFLLAQVDILVQLVRLARRERISVVRAGDPFVMGLYGWLIARTCGIPLVVRLAANYERVRRQTGRPLLPRLLRSEWVERTIERFVLSRADLVAAGNDDNLRYALTMGVPPERATVFRVGNLVDRLHFVDPAMRGGAKDIIAELHLDGRPFLLCVSRLEPMKMPDHALQALAAVRKQSGMDVALVMVGGGSLLDDLRQLADRLGIAGDVIFAGERDQHWLARLIPSAAAVLSPVTGRALAEVALAGAPTVAYDIDWQRELIKPGETGELVEPGDVSRLAGAAVALLNDPVRAQRLGRQLREATLAMMDPDRLDAHERAQYSRLFERCTAARVAGGGTAPKEAIR